jgi:predicted DNA binding CopG/RHH family protein
MVRTKPKSDKVLTIRLPEKDLIHLERYCSAQGRTKTEVLRQFIQTLPIIPD